MTRPNLDPGTLRWVADENAAEQRRYEAWSRERGSDEWHCQTRAREHAMLAKRYRGLATRIENAAKRGKR
jgi:hypothetical protein